MIRAHGRDVNSPLSGFANSISTSSATSPTVFAWSISSSGTSIPNCSSISIEHSTRSRLSQGKSCSSVSVSSICSIGTPDDSDTICLTSSNTRSREGRASQVGLLFVGIFGSCEYRPARVPGLNRGSDRSSGLLLLGGIHGDNEFADGGEVGRGPAALDAVERLRANAGATRQFGLRQAGGPPPPHELLRQARPVQAEPRRRCVFVDRPAIARNTSPSDKATRKPLRGE